MPKKWLTEEEALRYLDEHTEGRLATCDQQGQPYITPLNYVYHNGRIYIHGAKTGRKLDNIRYDNRICFEVSHTEKSVFEERPCGCSTRYTSVLVFGRAHIIVDQGRKAEILNVLMNRFAHGRPFQAVTPPMADACTVVEIVPDAISGKKNVDPE